MRNRTQEQYLKISVFIITLVMIVLRFCSTKKESPRFYPFYETSARFSRNRQYYCSILSFIHKGFHCVSLMNFGQVKLWEYCVTFSWCFRLEKEILLARKPFSWGFILYDFLVLATLSETLFLPFYSYFSMWQKCFIGEIF